MRICIEKKTFNAFDFAKATHTARGDALMQSLLVTVHLWYQIIIALTRACFVVVSHVMANQPLPHNAPMGEGQSIFSQLEHSSYGTFKTMFDALGLDITNFQLPRVVVVGCESAGKSSTLESITKCALFPRDRDICTKMPIRFDMVRGPTASITATDGQTNERAEGGNNDVTEIMPVILPFLEQRMRAMGDSVRTEEMVIRIEGPNVPTFTVIDLPGLRAFPQALMQATENLVDSYLRDPNTLVICVVPAAIDRLGTVRSIAKVLQHHCENRTILVLTKPDEMSNDDRLLRERVLDRVTMRAREMQALGFAACVAIKNRQHDEEVTPAEAQANEEVWMRTRLAGVNVSMVDDRGAVHDAAQEYATRLGVPALLREMDRLYHRFIVNDWKPRAVAVLTAEITARTADLNGLGPAVETFADIKAAVLEQTNEVWPKLQPFDVPVFVSNSPAGTRTWSKQVRDILPTIEEDVANHYDLAFVRTDLAAALMRDTPTKLARFEDMRTEVLRRLRADIDRRMDQPFKDAVGELFQVFRYNAFKTVTEQPLATNRAFEAACKQFSAAVHGYVLTEVVLPALEHAVDLPDDMPVREAAEVVARREQLTARIEHLRAAGRTIAGW